MYSYNNISNFSLKSDESGDSLSGQFSVNGDDGQNERSHHEGSIGGSQLKNKEVERSHLMITMLKVGPIIKANIQWGQAVRARKKTIKR